MCKTVYVCDYYQYFFCRSHKFLFIEHFICRSSLFFLFNMKIVAVISTVLLLLCALIDGQPCREGLFNWMIRKPPNEIDSYGKIRALTPYLEEYSEMNHNFNNRTKILSKVSCTSSWATKVNITILPKCMIFTVRKAALQFLTTDIQIMSININNSTFDDDMIDICYPLSPQLLDCSLIYYEKNCYYTNRETQILRIFNASYRLNLGDYYIDHQGRVFLCSEPLLTPVNSPRCNYIVLQAGQYTILPNDSLYVKESNKIIQQPSYGESNQNSVNVCYPLSIEFINCPENSLYIVTHDHYDILPGLKLFYRTHNLVLDPSQYYQYNRINDIVACVSPASLVLCNVLGNMYTFVECLSIIFLIILTIYHFVMSKQHIYRLCLISHSTTLICYYVVEVIERSFSGHDYLILCYILYFLRYFSLTSAYAWLTCMAFDICCSFSSLLTSCCKCRMLSERYAMLIYNLCGWGLPFVMCILLAIVEFDENLQKFLSVYPGVIGSCKCFCWFANHVALNIMHYGYDMLLFATNIVLYIVTVYNIRHENKETEIVNSRRRRQM